MDALHYLNMAVWLVVVAGIMWATHSRHVCDGILIKIGLGSLALGAAANALRPTFNSQLWIGCSIAAIILFFFVRLLEAKLKNQKPVFLSL